MRYGFVIDQRKCIGCHACTVACKEENQVPVGAFRTWVKYVERGHLPGHAPVLLGPPLQPLRRRAVRDDLPDARALQARRRHRRFRPRPLHRLQVLHAGAAPTTRSTSTPTRTPPRSATTARIASRAASSPRASSCARSRRSSRAISTTRATPIARIVAREQVQVRKAEQGTRPKVFYLGADTAALTPVAADARDELHAGRSGRRTRSPSCGMLARGATTEPDGDGR